MEPSRQYIEELRQTITGEVNTLLGPAASFRLRDDDLEIVWDNGVGTVIVQGVDREYPLKFKVNVEVVQGSSIDDIAGMTPEKL